MPSIVDLQPLRSQQVFVQLDNVQHELRVYQSGGGVAYDLTRENVVVLQGQRLIVNSPLIPYGYLSNGNLILISTSDNLADYNEFGLTQTLMFFSGSELEAINGI